MNRYLTLLILILTGCAHGLTNSRISGTWEWVNTGFGPVSLEDGVYQIAFDRNGKAELLFNTKDTYIHTTGKYTIDNGKVLVEFNTPKNYPENTFARYALIEKWGDEIAVWVGDPPQMMKKISHNNEIQSTGDPLRGSPASDF